MPPPPNPQMQVLCRRNAYLGLREGERDNTHCYSTWTVRNRDKLFFCFHLLTLLRLLCSYSFDVRFCQICSLELFSSSAKGESDRLLRNSMIRSAFGQGSPQLISKYGALEIFVWVQFSSRLEEMEYLIQAIHPPLHLRLPISLPTHLSVTHILSFYPQWPLRNSSGRVISSFGTSWDVRHDPERR